MRVFSLRSVEFCHSSGNSSGSGDALKTARLPSGEENHAFFVPCSSARNGRIAECLRSASGKVDAHQLPIREIADGAAVGGPERPARAFGAGEYARLQCFERTDVQQRRVLHERYKSKDATVGRYGRASIIAHGHISFGILNYE